MAGKVLLVGPHGVTGAAIADRLGVHTDAELITASRRNPAQARNHVSVDLLDAAASQNALAGLSSVTHLVFAGYTERATMAETGPPNVAMLNNTLEGLQAAGATLQRVVMIGGGKSYGQHLGPYKTPAKETDPRLLEPIFYNDQEDLLADRGARHGFSWTVLRPDLVMGFGLGSPMSLLQCLGVFAALSKHAGAPLRFPGSPAAWVALHQCTDVRVLAAAVDWALRSDAAANEVFNVTNGDQFRWQHVWPDIADVFDMPTASPQPMSLSEQMADKEAEWNWLINAHDLVPTPWSQIASWPFADGVWSSGYDMVQSTIKIRQAGFTDCIDSHESLVHHLSLLRKQRHLP